MTQNGERRIRIRSLTAAIPARLATREVMKWIKFVGAQNSYFYFVRRCRSAFCRWWSAQSVWA